MADFLTTSGISYNIENIILNAKQELFLVSPYLQISKTLYERLKDASANGVEITIVFGKDQLNKDERKSLESIKNIKLLFFKNLHAKCYFNEESMVITSMNMYEFSEKNNREMGILITQNLDKTIFEKAKAEVNSIISSAENSFTNTKNNSKQNKNGHCIRCNEKIELNSQKPYCSSCYNSWAFFDNYNFEEKFCHCCGKKEYSTMSKPLCYNCFKNMHYS